jgi:hypothetical protein
MSCNYYYQQKENVNANHIKSIYKLWKTENFLKLNVVYLQNLNSLNTGSNTAFILGPS